MSMNALDIIRKKPIYKQDPKVYHAFRGKKVWITGICGSIGWELAKTLLNFGADVGGIDCNEAKIATLLNNHKRLWKRVVPGMYTDILPRDEDFVFHCAAFKHVRLASFNTWGYEVNNSVGVGLLMERLKAAEAQTKVILCSTDKAAGESVMGKSKKAAEDHVVFYGGTALRLVNVAYSRGSVLAIWSKRVHRVCNPGVSRYWMQMNDAVYALCLVASEKGRYTVHGCPKFTMGEMKKAWDKEFGPKRWREFEMFNEAQDESLLGEGESMFKTNDVLGKIS